MSIWNHRLLLIPALLLAGCLPEKEKVTPTFSEPVYSQQYRHRSITAIVTLSETNIPTSGKIQLMVDVHAPADTEVILPNLGSLVAPLSIGDSYSEPVQSLPNKKVLHRQVWTLLPALPGRVRLQPLEISAGTITLETAPVDVHVTSLLPDGVEGFEIKDITDPLELLPEEEQRKQLGLIAGATAAGLILLIFSIKLIRRPKRMVVLTPHQKARAALQELPHDEMEKIQALNEILLAFVENYFNVSMAGKTLGEVCAALPKKALLGRRIKLEEFLTISEQARYSHIVSDHFPEEMEQFTIKFINETPEEPS
ncbi:hypothetical protein P4B35_04810 [Pontiellaceae bacterium B12227]|nr:hypothetical protein [Pontiellaceae bacterium B12227]